MATGDPGAERVVFGRTFRAGANRTGTPSAGQRLGFSPAQFPEHLLIAGETGHGKSALAERLLTTAHEALSGPRIIIDSKGDGLPAHIAHTIYQRQGTLDDVLYFPARNVLPAMNPLDIRPAMARREDRSRVVANTADRYTEVLRLLMGDGYDAAKRSPSLLKALLEALYDPIHGHDCPAHATILEASQQARETGTTPEVSHEALEGRLADLRVADRDKRAMLVQGIRTRAEHITQRPSLRALYNHVPTDDADPQFAMADWLDRDVTIIFDLQGLSTTATQALTTVLLAELWQALRARSAALPAGTEPTPVLLSIEETARNARTELLSELLAEGRGYGLSVVASLQYPRQVDHDTDQGSSHERLYHELISEAGSYLIGKVSGDPAIAEALSTPSLPQEQVAKQINNLPDGRWLFKSQTGFGGDTTEPELIQSPRLVCGRADADTSADPDAQAAASDALEACQRRTADAYGIVPTPTKTSRTANADAAATDHSGTPRTTLAVTQRFPDGLEYAPHRETIVCTHETGDGSCQAHYPPRFDGLCNAITCHGSLADVDPEAVPTVAASLNCTPEFLDQTDLSTNQVLFLQVVLNASRRQYDPLEYDLVHDSMRLLREYTGVAKPDIEPLIEADLLKKDDATKQLYYTVTPAGRDLLDAPTRHGVHHGPGCGDIGESTTHIAMVEALYRYVSTTYRDAADSAVSRVERYYAPDAIDGTLDVAGLDAAGEVVVAGEAERASNEATTDDDRGVRADYRKMAALEPADALWVVPSRSVGHEAVLEPLLTDDAAETLIDKPPYSPKTAMRDVSISAPGFTDVFAFGSLQNTLRDASTESDSPHG